MCISKRDLLLECGIGKVEIERAKSSSSLQEDQEKSVISQHRVLIFAQLKEMLDIIEEDLLSAHFAGTSYLRLDGKNIFFFLK